jgi:hypothetical protein
MEILAQRTIGHPRLDRHQVRCTVEGHDAIQPLHRDEVIGAVGDAIERVPRAEWPESPALPDDVLYLVD